MKNEDSMRGLVIQVIVANFGKGLDEIFGMRHDLEAEKALEAGVLPIEDYLNTLRDDELLDALDGQACQEYR